MSWDPKCECGHLASKHGYDRGSEVEYQGCFFDFRTCNCPETVMDVARRAALLDLAGQFEAIGQFKGSGATLGAMVRAVMDKEPAREEEP